MMHCGIVKLNFILLKLAKYCLIRHFCLPDWVISLNSCKWAKMFHIQYYISGREGGGIQETKLITLISGLLPYQSYFADCQIIAFFKYDTTMSAFFALHLYHITIWLHLTKSPINGPVSCHFPIQSSLVISFSPAGLVYPETFSIRTMWLSIPRWGLPALVS